MKRIKLIKKILLVDEGPKPLIFREELKPINTYKDGFEYCEFGNLNNDKTFYVIKDFTCWNFFLSIICFKSSCYI